MTMASEDDSDSVLGLRLRHSSEKEIHEPGQHDYDDDTAGSSSISMGSALFGESGTVSSMTPSAIVPLQTNPVPMQFSTIRLNTDLNHLPRDWAKTKFQGYGGSNSTTNNAFSAFTSLNLAHNYMDLVGKVDVISSSKNIKDLLKMPYQQSPHISLMVHRLGKTLLLEEFDVHKNLIRKESEQWQWLNDFFRRYVHKDKNLPLVPLNSPKKDLLSDWMYCNLIRHSITASVANNACTSLGNSNEVPLNMQQAEEETQDLKGFHHESIWSFHDRSMLVDSDLPIFGTDSKSPCISLRLRDSPPVNVLTGLDYWLDNLMSNVPEVAMVYHLNGFVQIRVGFNSHDSCVGESILCQFPKQRERPRLPYDRLVSYQKKYEILRTEDIPHLENSKFDADEVMELARNVMAFIKNKAAIDGHTYWLYKSEHDDTVKLYNLTEYCKRDLRTDDNPFTVPVGLLCYNVGRNIRVTQEATEKNCAIIRSMLENCLRLLDADTHPHVCADAHFLLADLWVPEHSLRDIWNDSGRISDLPDSAADGEDDDDDDEFDDIDNPDIERNCSEFSGCTLKEEPNEAVGREVQSINNLVSLQNMSLEESSKKRKSPESSPKKWDEKDANEVMVKELMIRGVIKRKAWDVVQVCRIAGETDERCRCALDHIRKGLQIIDKDLTSKSKKQFTNKKNKQSSPTPSSHNEFGANIERDQLRFAKPFVPIPLHYSPIHPKNDSSGEKTSADTPSPSERGSQNSQESKSNTSNASSGSDSDDWHPVLKLALLRKASLAFSILAFQFHDSLQKRGHTLRYIRYGIHCYECLFKQGPKRQPDALEDDIYLHLLHLAAKARSSMDSSGIAANRKDFDELGEVEAAILHSAQAILQMPKEAWVYLWPTDEEKNLRAAKELFLKVMRMKQLERKSAEVLRATVKRQYAVCIVNMGHIYRKRLEDWIAAGDTYKQIEPLMDKTKRLYEEAISDFLALTDRTNAGQLYTHMAVVHSAAAACLQRHNKDLRHPVSKHEYAIIDKMMAEYDKALSIFERNESSDQCREDIFHSIRDKWFLLASRYFHIANQESYKKAKELLNKSLNYCFVDFNSYNPRDFNSYRIGAIVHYNIAVISNREFIYAACDSTLHRNLRRKMYDHASLAFDLYKMLNWSKSQIAVKVFIIKRLLEEFEKIPATDLPKLKKALHIIMRQFTSLLDAVNSVHTNKVDPRDDSTEYPTLFAALMKVLDLMSIAFKLWLQLELNTTVYACVKGMFRRNLSYLSMDRVEPIALPLSQLLEDVNSAIELELNILKQKEKENKDNNNEL